jgi:uncharacterized protein YkwD
MIMKCPVVCYLVLLLLLTAACRPQVTENIAPVPPSEASLPAKSTVGPPARNTLADGRMDLAAIDFDLLDRLVAEEINKVRQARRVESLVMEAVLTQAAREQTNYQIRINRLSHGQADVQKRTVRDRVKLFGGDFRSLGENVLFQGMRIRTQNGVSEVLTNSYRSTAKEMVTSWVESPDHYRNLISPDFQFVGTATGYSPQRKALFATQVFGGQ